MKKTVIELFLVVIKGKEKIKKKINIETSEVPSELFDEKIKKYLYSEMRIKNE